jgi:plastocyanin
MRAGRGFAVAVVCAVAALALPMVAQARTKVVYAGGPASFQKSIQKKYGGGVDNFLVNQVVINAGDTVEWNGASLAGGFHTVDIPAKGGTDVPLILPSGGLVPNSVADAAGNPFWFDGKVPSLGINQLLFAVTGGHTYNGTERVDSGLPLGPKPVDFKVTFSKPGRYEYFCDVHPGMHGWVIVRARGKKVPTARDDAKALAASEKHYLAEAKRLTKTRVKGDKVQIGASTADGVEDFAMFPNTLTVKAGTVVTFFMSKDTRETHTASFGPEAYLTALANGFISNTGAIDPRDAYPSSPPGTVTLSPNSHGNGFANVGALDRDPTTPLPVSGTIDFTTPGTYHYICLIHSFMHGTIIVK